VANIGRTQRRWRFYAGLVGIGVTLVMMMTFASGAISRPWRVTVFVPILLTAICFLQVRSRTCVALAARGLCHLDGKAVTPVTDPRERQAMRAEARRISVRAVLLAACLTALCTFVP
jgi:hypothetical protein